MQKLIDVFNLLTIKLSHQVEGVRSSQPYQLEKLDYPLSLAQTRQDPFEG